MKTWIRRVVALVLVVVLFLSLQELVAPKYASSLFEGSFTSAYYDEKADHQVLMIGDCELYENIDTMTLWDKYGITSYIRGNAQQLPWQSYYLLKEALKKEYPDVVIYSVLPLKYNEPQKEEYNRLALENMKWSLDKVAAIRASMTEEEHFWDYVFPVLRYHTRITQLTEEDFNYYGQKVNHTVAGYYMRIDTAPYMLGTWGEENDVGSYTATMKAAMEEKKSEEGSVEDLGWSADADDEDSGWSADADDEDTGWSADDDVTASSEDDETEIDSVEDVVIDEEVEPLGDNAMYYLDKIRSLCEEKGVKLLLLKAPSVSPMWYDEWEQQIVEYADTYGLNYINYLKLVDEIGIDFATDTYDEGLHMNYAGAIKCADYLGDYLVTNYQLKDMRSDSKISKIWSEKAEFQQELIHKQESELEEFGEILSK